MIEAIRAWLSAHQKLTAWLGAIVLCVLFWWMAVSVILAIAP